MLRFISVKGKGKAAPLQARGGPEGIPKCAQYLVTQLTKRGLKMTNL